MTTAHPQPSDPPDPSGAHRRFAGPALAVIAASGIYRLLFVPAYPASTDEAFFWIWGTRLDWNYVDHPPLATYIMWALGNHPWAWRMTSIGLSCAAAWLLFDTGRRLFGGRAGMWAAIGFALCPMYTVLGSMLLPESLLVFWTTLALALAARLVISGHVAWFYPLGAVFGLGLLSNLPAMLIPTGLVAFGALSPRHRHWFRCVAPYGGVLIALILVGPMLYWNWVHDWASIRYLGERTEVGRNALPGLPLAWQTFMAQVGCHSPLTYAMLMIGLGIAAVRMVRRPDARVGLMLCLSLPLLVLFAAVSTRGNTQPHWPASAYPALYVLAGGVLFGSRWNWTRPRKALAALTLGLASTLTALTQVSLVYPMLAKVTPILERVATLPADAVEFVGQSAGWGQEIRSGLIELGDRITGETGERPVILTHLNVLAGLIDYYTGDVFEVISVHAQARQYDMWFTDADVADRVVLFVTADVFARAAAGSGRPEDYYVFDACAPQEPVIEVERHGVVVNRVRTWLCIGYRGAAARPAAE